MFLLGTKLGMSQLIENDGSVIPVTIIHAGPCYVTQLKTMEVDGYVAVQIGFGELKRKKVKRPQFGHVKNISFFNREAISSLPIRYLREFPFGEGDYFLGQKLTVDVFDIGQYVDVTAYSKGKGFQGGVKRYGFRGGPKTHGQSDRHRAPGSIGATSSVARVLKGTRMAGHHGNRQVTIQNLRVENLISEKNLIAVRGSIPGHRGSLVTIRLSKKKSNQ